MKLGEKFWRVLFTFGWIIIVGAVPLTRNFDWDSERVVEGGQFACKWSESQVRKIFLRDKKDVEKFFYLIFNFFRWWKFVSASIEYLKLPSKHNLAKEQHFIPPLHHPFPPRRHFCPTSFCRRVWKISSLTPFLDSN